MNRLKYQITFIFVGFLVYLFLGCGGSIVNSDSKGEVIICFGDSITQGVGADAGQDYPSLLSKKLGYGVINAGHSGDTTYDALKRIKEDVLNKNPKLVIVEFGANDFLKKIPRKETFTNLDKITEAIQKQGAMVAIATVKIGLLSDEYLRDYKKIAQKRKALLIPQIMKGVLNNPQFKSDGLHPNAQGYAIIAERVYRSIKPLVE